MVYNKQPQNTVTEKSYDIFTDLWVSWTGFASLQVYRSGSSQHGFHLPGPSGLAIQDIFFSVMAQHIERQV